MALKLKLKVKPSASPNSDATAQDDVIQASSKMHRNPVKVKDEPLDRVGKPKQKKEKLQKLKLSLGRLDLQGSATPSQSSQLPRAKSILKKIPKVRVKPTRIPGEGYDSEAPDVEDDPLIEQGILVRFLNDSNLDFVHNAVETGDLSRFF